jgi:hypothetical protein
MSRRRIVETVVANVLIESERDLSACSGSAPGRCARGQRLFRTPMRQGTAMQDGTRLRTTIPMGHTRRLAPTGCLHRRGAAI